MIKFRDFYNHETLPIGYGNISNRNPFGYNINEWVYDTGISRDEYEQHKRFFANHFHYDGNINRKQESELNGELEHHYHGPYNHEQKKEDFSLYTGMASHSVNTLLIKAHQRLPYKSDIFSNQELYEIAHANDDFMQHYMQKAPKDFHVYTGIGPDLDIDSTRKTRSNRMFYPAFTSASINPKVALGFSTNQKVKGPEKKYREVVRIHIPKNSTHGIYLGSTGLGNSTDHEGEFLINRRTIMQYMGEPRISRLGINQDPVLVHDARIIKQYPVK